MQGLIAGHHVQMIGPIRQELLGPRLPSLRHPPANRIAFAT
jgi:hypothetical protein